MPETTADATAIQLSVASFNVENLDPQDALDKFRRLAEQIGVWGATEPGTQLSALK
jgi:hypothetical protein